jgi:thymidylate kinase
VKGAFIHTLDRIGSRLRWIFKKRGFEMAFVGVDGGGKSTLSSEIIRRFNFLGCRKTLYLGPKFDNKVISITSRFLIALFGKLRSKFGVVTVYDRHLFDLVAYRDQSLFTTKLLKAIIPKPDYVFFCHADIDIILNRKEHDNRKLLEFVSQNYSTLSDEIDYFFNINTERTSDDAVSQIVKILDSRIRASLI